MGSRRSPMRGDDLVGGAAGDLRHVIELAGETAGAGGGRAQFHDQFADLGLRHHGADAIPARPPLAGVEAENLRSEEHTSELQSRSDLVCRLLLEKKKKKIKKNKKNKKKKKKK